MTDEDVEDVEITLTGFDLEVSELIFEVMTDPDHGTLDGPADSLTYTPDLNYKLLKRIVYKNKVIDNELVNANGIARIAVAIYTMKNGKITSVTFL